MDPYTAIIGAGMSMVGDVAKAPPAGPSNAESLGSIGGAMFDNSGWNVSFGDASPITAERTQTEKGQFSQYMPYIVVGAVFLVAWRYAKK